MLSISKIGQVVFNQPAARILEKENIHSALLLWDGAAKKLALKASRDPKDTRAYTIRFNPKGNGASFSAKTFLDFTGIDYSQRKSVPISINVSNEHFVEIVIPADFFKKE